MLIDQEIGPLLSEGLKLGFLLKVPITSLPLQLLVILSEEAQVFVESDTCIAHECVFTILIALFLNLIQLASQAIQLLYLSAHTVASLFDL